MNKCRDTSLRDDPIAAYHFQTCYMYYPNTSENQKVYQR